MRIIAAVDSSWGIGAHGELLVSIPEDMKLFREETMGKTIIMGRKTYEKVYGLHPLVGRKAIVLTKKKDFKPLHEGDIVAFSVDEVLELTKELSDEECYVCGGESIYKAFLPYCNSADITKIDYRYQADRHMPDLDSDGDWHITAESEEKTYFNLIYSFIRYERKKK